MPDLSKREQVMAALTARLTALLPDVTVQRNRRSVPDADEAPLLIVYDGQHTADNTMSAGETAYEMQAVVDATVTAAIDDDLGPTANALYLRTVVAIMADPTLGGVVTDTTEASFETRVVTAEESQAPLMLSSLALTISFHTAYGNPIAD
jgi:hypothetical protein